MSCPDWPTLAHRRDQGAEGELLWQGALEHLDRCEHCREAAYAAEPTLVFRRMPKVEANEKDIQAMKQAVAAMRRVEPLVEPTVSKRSRLGAGGSSRWMRMAAGVLVVAGAAFLYQAVGPEAPGQNVAPPPGELASSGSALTSPAETLFNVGEPSPRHLRFEIQVLRASNEEPTHSALEDQALLDELKSMLTFENYQVVASASVPSGEKDSVISTMGNGLEVSFKSGPITVSEEESGTVKRLQIEDFQIQTTVKGRRTRLLNMPLDLTLDRPHTVIFSQDRDESLVLAVVCRAEEGPSDL